MTAMYFIQIECLCQDSSGLKVAQKGTEGLKLIKGLKVLLKCVHIYVCMSAAPKLFLLPASRYDYNVYQSNINVSTKSYLNSKGPREGSRTSNLRG